MVRGLDVFTKAFSGLEESYVIIGGTACDLIFHEREILFRATKDIDIVLQIETRDAAFAKTLLRFIDQGEYSHRNKSNDGNQFYRFKDPNKNEYPKQIELFSKLPDTLTLEGNPHIVPIHFGKNIRSLSAILLDDNYYSLIVKGKEMIKDIPIVSAEYLIPLKAKAFIDMEERKSMGDHVDNNDIKKQLYDVLKLSTIINPSLKIDLTETVRDDIKNYIEHVLREVDDASLKNRLIPANKDRILSVLRAVYNIAGND
jgi:hypothetical protein